MPVSPPTVDDLEAALTTRVAYQVADVGLFLDGPDGTTKVFRDGLRLGAQAVGISPASALDLADADLLYLTPFAASRVLDEAELHALRRVLALWHRAEREHDVPAVAPMADTRGGWLATERAAARERVADLKDACSIAYREPASSLVAADPADRCPWPCGHPGGYGLPYPFGPGGYCP